MFNPFKKQEPEKPKPNFIGEQHEHKACAIIFEDTASHRKANDLGYGKISVVKGKEIVRLSAMIDSSRNIVQDCYTNISYSIAAIQRAANTQEAIAIQLGLIPTPPAEGYVVCPECL